MLTEVEIKTINHLGIVAGIIDELQIQEIINQEIGIDPQEIEHLNDYKIGRVMDKLYEYGLSKSIKKEK